MRVDDNQLVTAGQLLVLLDPTPYKVALERVQAQLQQGKAQVTQARAQVAQREAAAQRAAANQEKAQSDYDRATGLYQEDVKAVSKSDVDNATAALRSAESDSAAAKADTAAAQAQREVAEAGVVSAKAGVHDSELQLSYTHIFAPIDGRVGMKNVESGQRIQPGQALMAVVERDIWVLANLKETQLAQVRPGQSVAIEIDAIPDHEFVGNVQSFQPGSGSTFALLPPDNATGNFTKIVQRVPVKIVFDPESVRGYEDRIYPVSPSSPKSIYGLTRQPRYVSPNEHRNSFSRMGLVSKTLSSRAEPRDPVEFMGRSRNIGRTCAPASRKLHGILRLRCAPLRLTTHA